MEVPGVLVLALILMGSGIAQGQPAGTGRGEVLLNSLEQKVRDIATQALANVQNAGDLVQSCNAGSTDCSRAECQPLCTDGASPSYSCGNYPAALPFCSNQFPACNNKILSTRTMGYVRLPVVADDPDRVLCDIRQSICVQRNLDSTFQNATTELSAQYNNSIYFHMYFGSVAGDFRYFPGRDATNCSFGPYDPRMRLWYTEAISVVKNLVVLIDNGASMIQPIVGTSNKPAYTVANNLAEALLRGAVTKDDTISVVGYNSGISFDHTLNVIESSNTAAVSSQLESFLSEVRVALVPVDLPSNMTVGLERAQVLLNATDTSDCKIIVLFTHNSSDPLQYSKELADTVNRGTKLFLYTLGGTATQNNSCHHFECLGPLAPATDNLLLKLNGFFSFLARSRKEVGLLKPHWKLAYDSSSRIRLGKVITVGMPALDDSGQLVGVAGIDVPMDDLKSGGLELDIRTALGSPTRNTAVPRGISGEDLRQAAPLSSPVATCDSALVLTNVVCPRNFEYSPQLLCCDGCGGKRGPQCAQPSPPSSFSPPTSPGSPTPPTPQGSGDSAPLNIIIPVCVVGGLLVVVGFWMLKKQYFPSALPPAPQPPPNLSLSAPEVSPEHQGPYL